MKVREVVSKDSAAKGAKSAHAAKTAKPARGRRGSASPESREAGAGTLQPPDDAVVVRLYRIGHGDCFLLAFPGTKGRPVYVLIDCGYKPGSPGFLPNATTAAAVCADLKEATGGYIDVVVVTHEHQDHINGFTAANFKGITFGACWFAWTEDPEDALANKLRLRFKDRLALLMQARAALAAAPDTEGRRRIAHIDDFLEFELGGTDELRGPAFALAATAVAAGDSANKRAMKLVREKSASEPTYLKPHAVPIAVPGTDGVKVFTLGPPRNEELLHSLDPEGDEGYRQFGFGGNTRSGFFAAGLSAHEGSTRDSPFSRRYGVRWDDAVASDPFFKNYYGASNDDEQTSRSSNEDEAPGAPAWRRIDSDWLYPAEQLALDMNNDTNNGSLVLAFELSKGGKVLLFAADAQRGNWISWSQGTWKDGSRVVDARDLLGRTVLYKVGHHGSHNATLHGTNTTDYANLDWMASAEHEGEFTAMITAVRKWADTQKGWDHPLKSIKDALLKKSEGRLFQTDTDVTDMTNRGSARGWKRFMMNVSGTALYFDYTVPIG